jgi:ABC-type lipoprotein release transport system permease subunit
MERISDDEKSDFNVFVMLMDAVLGMLITILASILPAFSAAYKKPGEALRYV